MDRLHAPGAAFVLVKDGEIVLSKGYGYANIEDGTEVDPETTVFRVGSISKLFTATAIMQLHERGQINLEDDVNKHLTLFKIEQNYDKPVTIANLLTHTGGFNDHFIGQHTRNISDLKPLGEYLAAKMPPRVMPSASS
jgi:CubicO group peptidase (beta-lactamase class C family)